MEFRIPSLTRRTAEPEPTAVAVAEPVASTAPVVEPIRHEPAEPGVVEHVAPPVRERSRTTAVRPWSALIVGTPDDRTLLIADWLLLACREAGFVAHAVPLDGGADQPHGMYVEVAASLDDAAALGSVPWGAVDLVVAGEHLELARAIAAGFVDPTATTVVSSCRRAFTAV